MPSGKKKKRHKMSTHKRKKRLRKNRHKSKKYKLVEKNTPRVCSLFKKQCGLQAERRSRKDSFKA